MSFKRPRYTAGFPTGALAPGSTLARYERYDSTTQQISDLQKSLQAANDAIGALQNQVLNMQTDIVVRRSNYNPVSDSPNLIANGDFSQNTFGIPGSGVTKYDGAHSSTDGFLMQNRTIPVIDRWYHTSSWAVLQPGNLVRMTATQIAYTSDGTTTPQPRQAKHALQVVYTTPNKPTGAIPTPPASNAPIYGCIGLLHRIPDVTQFQNTSFTLSFWIKSSHAWNFCCVVQRQYNQSYPSNATGTGPTLANTIRPPGLEFIGTQAINAGLAWTQVTMTLNFGALQNYHITPDYNGLLIGIYPFYHSQFMEDNATVHTYNPSGTDIWTLMNNNINPDFTITEIQLLPGNIPPPTQFFGRGDEGALTRPYIAQLQLPTDIVTTGKSGYSYGSMCVSNTTFDGDGKKWPLQRFQLHLPQTLLRKPEYIMYITNGHYGAVLWSPRRREDASNNVTWDSGLGIVNASDNTPVERNIDLKEGRIMNMNRPADFTGLSIIQDQEQLTINPNLSIFTNDIISSGITNGTYTFDPPFASGLKPQVYTQVYYYDGATHDAYVVNVTNITNTGFDWYCLNATMGALTTAISKFGWVAIIDTATSTLSNMSQASDISLKPTGVIRPTYTDLSTTYVGNGNSGSANYSATNNTQIRRLTYDMVMSANDTIALDIATSPVIDPSDDTNINFATLPYTTGRTHVRSAALQLDSNCYFVALINEFEQGAPDMNDNYAQWGANWGYQSIYSIAYFPNPPNL